MSKMMIELDTEDEKYIRVTSGGSEVKPIPLSSKRIKLKIDNEETVPFILDHAVIRSHSSPGCINYIHNGQLYRV
jgi:hypothetical protein